MTSITLPRLAVSTWSLHRTLGWTYSETPGEIGERVPTPTYGTGAMTLLEIPAKLAAMGIRDMEICHFQLPHREAAYLGELRSALKEAGVHLLTLLIDDGDITHPALHEAHLRWTAGWIETAAELQAERARVIAGKQPCSEEAYVLSREGLHSLAEMGAVNDVRVITENWYPLLERPETVLRLLDSLEGAVGLNLDFGNWGGPTKYDDLAEIFPCAESCHAKCQFPAPRTPDAEEYRRCLALARAVGFTGPFTLIYDSEDPDEWAGLTLERDVILNYFQ